MKQATWMTYIRSSPTWKYTVIHEHGTAAHFLFGISLVVAFEDVLSLFQLSANTYYSHDISSPPNLIVSSRTVICQAPITTITWRSKRVEKWRTAWGPQVYWRSWESRRSWESVIREHGAEWSKWRGQRWPNSRWTGARCGIWSVGVFPSVALSVKTSDRSAITWSTWAYVSPVQTMYSSVVHFVWFESFVLLIDTEKSI